MAALSRLARAAFLLKSVSAVGEFAIYWSEGGRLDSCLGFAFPGHRPRTCAEWPNAASRKNKTDQSFIAARSRVRPSQGFSGPL